MKSSLKGGRPGTAGLDAMSPAAQRLVSSKLGNILVQWLVRLTAKAKVATVLGSIPASSDTVDSEGRQIKYR